MLRYQNQQPFKALRSLLRGPLHSPLQLSVSRYVHTKGPSLHEPPTYNGYDRIDKRISLQPNLTQFYNEKWAQERMERGQFVDIHDGSLEIPGEYDMLITDRRMRTELSDLMGIEYLAEATEAEANQISEVGNAIIFGHLRRTIFPCVVSHENKAHWIFFLVMSGSPRTYLSKAAAEVLNIPENKLTEVNIAGFNKEVQKSPKGWHFEDLNILGTDFASKHGTYVFQDYKNNRAQLLFGGKWDVVEKEPVL